MEVLFSGDEMACTQGGKNYSIGGCCLRRVFCAIMDWPIL